MGKYTLYLDNSIELHGGLKKILNYIYKKVGKNNIKIKDNKKNITYIINNYTDYNDLYDLK